MRWTKSIIGWMFYDFANSAFTTIIVSVVYSAYFVKSVVIGDPGYGEMLWGRAVAISMTLVAISAPIFGAVADHSRAKKRFLFINCYLTIIFTSLLFFVKQGDVMLGMILFIIANFGFNSANVFYDAFLPEITRKEDIGKTSGYGWAWGYVGGLVSLVSSLILLKTSESYVRYIFPMIGLHLFVYSLVTFVWLKEVRRPSRRTNYFRVAYQRIRFSLLNVRKLSELYRYLISYMIYNSGIYTVILFAAIYGINRFGMSMQDMIIYFIFAQFSSILGSLLFGWIADKTDVKESLVLSLLIWILVVVWAFFCRSSLEYYCVGFVAGLAIGSSQANSRTMLSILTPKDKQAEFFGFYTLTGRLSSIFGPLLYGTIAYFSGSIRFAILSLIIFFISGWLILNSVKLDKGISDANLLLHNNQ
ncbi:MAG: MFS transporter [Candidatus Cloacimonetes bacterium]|nr:MFS transporter [Candidatus Cloacimonadota bacterium]